MAGSTKKEETKVTGSDNSKTSIAIIDEKTIRNKIYEVRGVKVMLDFELAAIYGYNTTAFNQQVKNNIEKFEGDDFCFYLTQEEFRNLMSKNLISSWGGRRKPPRAFTVSRGTLPAAETAELFRQKYRSDFAASEWTARFHRRSCTFLPETQRIRLCRLI